VSLIGHLEKNDENIKSFELQGASTFQGSFPSLMRGLGGLTIVILSKGLK
jgi:hypothetical protein